MSTSSLSGSYEIGQSGLCSLWPQLHNMRTSVQAPILGFDYIHSYTSDPMRNVDDRKRGCLKLTVQIFLTDKGPKIEPMPHWSARTSPSRREIEATLFRAPAKRAHSPRIHDTRGDQIRSRCLHPQPGPGGEVSGSLRGGSTEPWSDPASAGRYWGLSPGRPSSGPESSGRCSERSSVAAASPARRPTRREGH